MFKPVDTSAVDLIEIELDGETVTVPDAISVAAAMFYLDALPIRHSAISHSPRAPFCMMGACFECLVEVDGNGNQRGCQISLRAGMKIRRQLSASGEDPV